MHIITYRINKHLGAVETHTSQQFDRFCHESYVEHRL